MFFRIPEIQPYGVFSIIGIITVLIYACVASKKVNIAIEDFFICFGYSAGFGFAFAKIFYLLINAKFIKFSRLFLDYQYLKSLIMGGFVFYGGVIGVLIALLLVRHIHKIDAFYIANIISPSFPLAHAFGRVGCYYAGCCFGIPVNPNYWHVTYQSPFHPARGIPLLPIQLIEALMDVFLFIALTAYLIYLSKNNKLSKMMSNGDLDRLSIHSVFEYRIFTLYIFSYSIVRVFIEFFRYDAERGFLFHLSTSQIISLVLIGVITFAFYHEHRNKNISSRKAN